MRYVFMGHMCCESCHGISIRIMLNGIIHYMNTIHLLCQSSVVSAAE